MTNENKSINLDDLDVATPSNEGTEIEILHPTTNVPLGIFIKVLGKFSDKFIEHSRKATNEYLRRAQQLKKRGKDEEAFTVEKGEARSVETLVACTVGWRTWDNSVIAFDGEDRPFTAANAERLYSSSKWIWLREQVDSGIGDIGNFMKG